MSKKGRRQVLDQMLLQAITDTHESGENHLLLFGERVAQRARKEALEDAVDVIRSKCPDLIPVVMALAERDQ